MSHTDMTADLSEVLEIADRSAAGFAPETKSGHPGTASPGSSEADPLARIASAMERGNDLIERKATAPRPAPALPAVRAPAEVRARLQKASALAELRTTAEADARRPDALNGEKQRRINADLDARDAADRTELAELRRKNADLERRLARPPAQTAGRSGPIDQKAAAFGLYRGAITQYLRTGQEVFQGKSLRELQDLCIKLDAKAFNASVNAEGGYFVQPEQDTGPVERLLADLSPMRSLATVRSISSASFKKRINLRGSTARWVGETTATTTDTTPSYGELEFPAMTLLAEPEVTTEALEDASIDIEMMLAEDGQYDFAEKESAAYISGDGDKKPVGLLSASHTYIASASWAWGKVGYLATGSDGAFAGTGPGDVIVKLPHELKAEFRQQGSWLVGRSTVGAVRALRDSQGRYLWSEGDVSKGVPNTLNGYVVHEDEQMPAIGSGAHAMAFGDWRRAYIIVDRVGFQVFRNPYINPPYVRYHMRKRVGGGIQRYDAFRTIKFAAS